MDCGAKHDWLLDTTIVWYPIDLTNSTIDTKSWTLEKSGDKVWHMTAGTKPSEVPMRITLTSPARRRIFRWKFPRRFRKTLSFVTLILLVPAVAVAQSGSPFDTGFTALQNLFTGTVAKVASLIAIVIGGYEFAHGEPGAKKTLAGVAAGSGIAVLAVNVLNWLWGI